MNQSLSQIIEERNKAADKAALARRAQEQLVSEELQNQIRRLTEEFETRMAAAHSQQQMLQDHIDRIEKDLEKFYSRARFSDLVVKETGRDAVIKGVISAFDLSGQRYTKCRLESNDSKALSGDFLKISKDVVSSIASLNKRLGFQK